MSIRTSLATDVGYRGATISRSTNMIIFSGNKAEVGYDLTVKTNYPGGYSVGHGAGVAIDQKFLGYHLRQGLRHVNVRAHKGRIYYTQIGSDVGKEWDQSVFRNAGKGLKVSAPGNAHMKIKVESNQLVFEIGSVLRDRQIIRYTEQSDGTLNEEYISRGRALARRAVDLLSLRRPVETATVHPRMRAIHYVH